MVRFPKRPQHGGCIHSPLGQHHPVYWPSPQPSQFILGVGRDCSNRQTVTRFFYFLC